MRSGGIRSVCSEWVTRFYFLFIIFLSISLALEEIRSPHEFHAIVTWYFVDHIYRSGDI